MNISQEKLLKLKCKAFKEWKRTKYPKTVE